MENKYHPKEFGAKVRDIRKSNKMNQVEFYNYLFPDNKKETENIKKKMNAVENGKQSFIDFDLFIALSKKCDVSADYLIGNDTYKNHDMRSVCEYTGLNETAVSYLHKWSVDSNNGADLSIIGHVYTGDDGEQKMHNAFEKQTALQYLSILNHLFKGGETKEFRNGKEQKVKFSNLGLLYSLYLLCMTNPVRIIGTPLLEDAFSDSEKSMLRTHPYLEHYFNTVTLDASKPIALQDDNETWYTLSVQDVFEQLARKRLERSIDRLVKDVREHSICDK